MKLIVSLLESFLFINSMSYSHAGYSEWRQWSGRHWWWVWQRIYTRLALTSVFAYCRRMTDCSICSVSKFGSLPQPSNLTLSTRPYNTTHFELFVSWNPPSGGALIRHHQLRLPLNVDPLYSLRLSSAKDLLGYKIYIYANPIASENGESIAKQEQFGCHCAASVCHHGR